MTSPQPTGVLDLFVLQASDYIEHIDAVVGAAGSAGPDGEALARAARMLRGSATMTKVPGIGEIAAGIERVARALREGALVWEPGLRGTIVAAVDDLKILVRAVRTWGPGEDQRAQGRSSELARYAPQLARANTPSVAGGGAAFLANEAAEIAFGLDQLLAHPGDSMLLASVLGRVRGLRGVAATKDVPPLSDVVDALDRVGKPLELAATPEPTAAQMALFQAAAALLRRAAIELRSAGRPDPTSPEVHAFTTAAAAIEESSGDADRIVPIADLFFGDAGPHLVSAAPNPPTTPQQRFRLEGVSQAEHLLRLISEAMVTGDPVGRQRLSRELRVALRALQAAADSFAERDVAAYIARGAEAVAALEPSALTAMRQIAATLADPSARADQLGQQLARLTVAPAAAPAPRPAAAQPDALTSAPARAPNGGRARTPSGRDLAALLDTGIASLGQQLSARPLSNPVPIVDENLVPIETLLYRGRAALARMLSVRNDVRAANRPPSPDEMAELLDLIELAAAD
jgi:chemotaxis protein histidine kinase CheA